MQIKTRLTFDKVRHDQDTEVHLVVSLKAPEADSGAPRSPLCVIPVVDVSGSMGGGKLNYAKKSVLKLIEHLKDEDFCGVVAFDNEVKEIHSPVQTTGKNRDSLAHRVGALKTGGCTNFAGGMLKGLEWANAQDLPQGTLVRVIMFTDGHANEGPATDYKGLSRLLKGNRGKVSLSAFGYGNGADQDLLASLAQDGDGSYAFVNNPEDALTAFATELGGLLSTYATDLHIEVTTANGHKIIGVLSDVDSEGDEKGVKIKEASLLSEQERHYVFKLGLSSQTKALPRALNVADIKVSYTVINEDGQQEQRSLTSKSKVRFVKPGEEQIKANKEVDEIVAMSEILQAQLHSEELAKQGDYEGAASNIKKVVLNVRGRDLMKIALLGEKLGGNYDNAQMYHNGSSYRATSRSLLRSHGTRVSSCDGAAAKDYLQASGLESLGNSKQAEVVASFNADPKPPTIVHQQQVVIVNHPAPVVAPTPQTPPEKGSLTKSRSDKQW